MSKAVTTRIVATSRASVKIKDSFYTVEFQEERTIPVDEEVDIKKERAELWDTVNTEVDEQIAQILDSFK